MYKNLEGKVTLTSDKKHRKHNKLPRAEVGNFGRSEIALVGAKCGAIQQLVRLVIEALSNKYNISYIDADHSSFDNPEKGDYLAQGAQMTALDKQESYQILKNDRLNSFDQKMLFAQQDLVLVNGSHFEAKYQILFLDSTKAKSIQKRLNQLTHVIAIVEVDQSQVVASVSEQISNLKELPRFSIDDEAGLIRFVGEWMASRTPEIKALILTGGKSQRMGVDKSTLMYDNQRQLDRVTDVVGSLISDVYISCMKGQVIETDYPIIVDLVDDMGPLGAIESAFRSFPNNAWLVVACDLPLLDKSVIEQLLSNRSVKHVATAFLNSETGFAEPLITIWEPKSYVRMKQFEALGYSCPRKVLINSDTNLLTPNDSGKLTNVNTPEEYRRVAKQMN
ncbi:MAG: molybdopterin-guanine dinucleotide biosynthesis protein A [Bacteroidia bacterium]